MLHTQQNTILMIFEMSYSLESLTKGISPNVSNINENL